jgi:hypothetical protein
MEMKPRYMQILRNNRPKGEPDLGAHSPRHTKRTSSEKEKIEIDGTTDYS